MKILIIGGGNMGMTYAQSLLRAHLVSEEGMMILEKSPTKAEELRKRQVGTVYSEAEACIGGADLVILAVKPQDAPALFQKLRSLVDPQQLFLSIMAGITIEQISAELNAEKIIRAMPNLPAQIGMGMTAYTASESVTRIELVMVQNLLNTTGKAIYVAEEGLINATTAISGSGPAYVFYFMEAMMEAARRMGFDPAQSELLVSQTFRGAVELFSKSDFTCSEWIQRVSSRGGTTEAAMNTFRETTVFEDIVSGAQSALERADALGKAKVDSASDPAEK